MTHFAITGRLHGDDEDHCRIFECDTVVEARQAFIDEVRISGNITPEDVESGEEYANVYITTVLRSSSPIEVV